MTFYRKHFRLIHGNIVFAMCTACIVSNATADIYQWEYIDPLDPSQGKRQSTTLAPGGAGVNAVPGANLFNRDLTMAYLIGANLTGANVSNAVLINADLSQANLREIYFENATLTGANLSNADVSSAYFAYTIGFGSTQLYSTASYQNRDLVGIVLYGIDLTGWNFAGQNLQGASIVESTLVGTNFNDADVRGAWFYVTTADGFTAGQLYSTASYKSHDLTGIGLPDSDLTGWNFEAQNLTNATFVGSTLVNANFHSANLVQASFSDFFNSSSGANLTGANLSESNLSNAILNYATLHHADLGSADLSGAYLDSAALDNANLSQAILSQAYLYRAKLTGANFTNADVRGATFGREYVGVNTFEGTGLSAAQFYSTASYQDRDLAGIRFYIHDLSGWNFANQNLRNASFFRSILTGANFSEAEVRGAQFRRGESSFGGPSDGTGISPAQLYSTASYQARDLSGIDFYYNTLNGVDFSHQNLTGVNLNRARYSGADFTGAVVRGANFDENSSFGISQGLTAANLYSTASYETRDLRGISLQACELTGWSFAGQNLEQASLNRSNVFGANFANATIRGADLSYITNRGFTPSMLYSTASYMNRDLTGILFGIYDPRFSGSTRNNLSGWNFVDQNLSNASFHGTYGTNMIGTDFRRADLRGVVGLDLTNVVATNAILPDGRIDGLHLVSTESLTVNDYDGFEGYRNGQPPLAPLPILVEEQMTLAPGATLRLVFDSDNWDSLISFEAGIPVALNGNLELAFAPDVHLPTQVGRTFDLFDWSGVAPEGQFNVVSPYAWDLSQLYTTGEITLIPEPSTCSFLILTLLTIGLYRSAGRDRSPF